MPSASTALSSVPKAQSKPSRRIWGDRRLAAASLFLLEGYDSAEPVNLGTGVEVSIAGLAGLIAGIVGFTGRIVWHRSRPDGVGRWLLDTRKLAALGWTTQVGLEDGLRRTYAWYCRQVGPFSSSRRGAPVPHSVT